MTVALQWRVLVVDDHALTRMGLCADLNQDQRFTVVGEACHGAKALAMIRENVPDLIVMDVGMPVMDGITATRMIHQQYPNIRVVMLTSHQSTTEIWAAMHAGANGYCLKDCSQAHLLNVLACVMTGGTWLDAAIAHVLTTTEVKPKTPNDNTESASHLYDLLSDREQEVLALIVEGYSNQDMAEHLVVTVHTIKAHVSNIMQKLMVADRTQAAVLALRQGWVE